ncbi:hypothetical protein HELRODRAFT_113366 [Helobdella robusta]|uniref:Uncharacterized protein n=1 Tax=Helobdella robusta TaxID=6412 RepID=T1EFR8_HELRO|nr:hypothetical protein HELRODRAFT_113366 [Helobdella robusta]ESN99954.1 hypothetical protein HELRODRAFT_113366 [Helobdella robusta]
MSNEPNPAARTRVLLNCEREAMPKLDKSALKKLIIASVLCLIFMIGEIAGGYLAGSLAIATDAAHMSTDLASFLISIFSVCLASKPPGKKLNFGWQRAETVGALVSIMFIWGVTTVLVFLAILRLRDGSYEINATIMLITASLALAFNIVMAACLHGFGRHRHRHQENRRANGDGREPGPSRSGALVVPSEVPNEELYPIISRSRHVVSYVIPSHPTSDESDIARSSRLVNINVRAAFIHVVGDIFQSLGVLVASLIIYFKPEYKIADPICTFIFSGLVIITTIRVFLDTMGILMNACPGNVNIESIKEDILEVSSVHSVHNLRIWQLSSDHVCLSVHVVLKKMDRLSDRMYTDNQLIAELFKQNNIHFDTLPHLKRLLKYKYSFTDVTIQIEPYGTFDREEDLVEANRTEEDEASRSLFSDIRQLAAAGRAAAVAAAAAAAASSNGVADPNLYRDTVDLLSDCS